MWIGGQHEFELTFLTLLQRALNNFLCPNTAISMLKPNVANRKETRRIQYKDMQTFLYISYGNNQRMLCHRHMFLNGSSLPLCFVPCALDNALQQTKPFFFFSWANAACSCVSHFFIAQNYSGFPARRFLAFFSPKNLNFFARVPGAKRCVRESGLELFLTSVRNKVLLSCLVNLTTSSSVLRFVNVHRG